jgi:histone H3/H4
LKSIQGDEVFRLMHDAVDRLQTDSEQFLTQILVKAARMKEINAPKRSTLMLRDVGMARL